ncbi:hypothetical protein J2858_000166 [Neorhizobium galegae]|uniref:hypothetical protein n=1 Tax=Rhizobium/Agrobacterium group TaxID=227290 RepID=UPI001AE4271D|nr:hypothetical protein [Neorhizobium galegae]MBP2547273.1 hypothetical protein [Neorhizobium galegae]
MRKILATAVLAVLGTAFLAGAEAQAISRYNSTAMSCAAVQDAIAREGAAILRYPGRNGITLYDRYVASGRLCASGEFAKASSVPTTDLRNCPVRHCERRPDPEDCRNFLEPGCFGLD